ncbi:hypothetical protein FDECE_12797 [Fusarium decemcellulare]|nr:hypothetical protein FDECE_12797 [Fusarium decemcellulare]
MASEMEDTGVQPPDVTLTQAALAAQDTTSSDVRMTDGLDDESSDASSYDPAAALFDNITRSSGIVNNKRKSPGSTDLNQPDNVKRARLQEDEAVGSREPPSSAADQARQLPAEIWQHIFALVPPRTLGRLLSVNKLFHTFLSPSSPSSRPKPHSLPSNLPPLKPDAIWQASRRLFWPRMPAPLKGKSELHMWRLICSVSCQFCGLKADPQSLAATDEWHRGPGAKGVSPVFPFSVCICGTCLEIDLLLSSTVPSLLLPALPPVLMTHQMHVLPPRVMQTGVLPPNTQVTKFFWSEHIEQIKNEFEQVKVLGSAATEEWIKGLEIRGKQALVDASRWEKWDLSGGLHQVRMFPSPAKTDPSKLENPAPVSHSSPKPLPIQPLADSTHNCDEQQDRGANKSEIPGLTPKPDAVHQPSRNMGQQKRTKEEVAQLKAQRRADIERRAMLLDPPLTASVLAHIPSFQAALQLITPLDDNAWELLKPRLLAQKSEAEQRERENAANSQILQDNLVTQQNGSRPAREPRQVPDQEWDDIQGPVRTRISAYADEIIKKWNNGEKLKKKNCPQFAADVLLYVRKRFYAEVAKDNAAAIAAGKQPIVEPPEGPWTQKLTLENMKWVFDVKVKPHTEEFRKELFLCNGCNGTLKYFGFEGVIQHYAAKHTGALSLGNVVVHWRAEWPAVPPFSPEPRASELAHYGKNSSYAAPQAAAPAQQGYPGYHPGPPTGYGPPGYGPTLPAPPPPQYSSGPSALMPPANQYGHAGSHVYGAPYSSAPYADTMAYASYPPFPPTTTFSPHGQINGYAGSPASAAPGVAGYGAYPGHLGVSECELTDIPYNTRLAAMKQVARTTFLKMAGVKKLPTTLKVCAIIHHIAKTFHHDYNEEASLSMFIDMLSDRRKDMRCVRIVDGLACKACGNKCAFSLPQLASHFMKQHVEDPESRDLPAMDWRSDMVPLPDETYLASLKKRLQQNHVVYGLMADTIPWAFEEEFINRFARKFSPLESSAEGTLTEKPNGSFDKSPAKVPGAHGNKQGKTHGAPKPEGVSQQPAGHQAQHQPLVELEPASAQSQPHVQPYDGSKQDIPHLRPASEVYGRKKRRIAAVQGQSIIDNPGQETPQSDRRPASGPEGADKLNEQHQQAEARMKTESNQEMHVRPRTRTHWRDEQPLDYRDAREQYHSGIEPSGPRDRSASVGNRPREYQRPNNPSSNAAPSFVEASPRGERQPNLAEYRQGVLEEEVVYVDESGREIARGMRARDTLPRDTRYGVPDDHSFSDHRYGPPPRYEDHDSAQYRELSTQPRHAPPVYNYAPEPAPRPAYYDYRDSRPPPGPPVEAYELVEVHDPQGDYFIRRPVRRDERDYYTYDARLPLREQNVYPSHRAPEGHLDGRMGGYISDPRAVSTAPGRPMARPEYDDYDPRYPSSSTGQGPHHDQSR